MRPKVNRAGIAFRMIGSAPDIRGQKGIRRIPHGKNAWQSRKKL
jgi:hypothetical protein